MMFLSEIQLNYSDMRRERISDDYSIHRFVYSLFPVRNTSRRILYADMGAAAGGLLRTILVLSDEEPQPGETIRFSTRIVSDDFLSFPDYRFLVAMNPVRKDPESGSRRPVLDHLDEWFCTRAPKWGFEVNMNSLEVFVRPARSFLKNNARTTFHRVDFSGRLHVSDPALFRRTFSAGLGHGKAFGFGLLQLSPVYFDSQI